MKTSSKNYDKQLAASYIVYMMGGSFFHKCSFANSYEETRLYLHYAEMPIQKQYECESRVLGIMSKMDHEFLKNIQELNCQVKCVKQDGEYILIFQTGGFEEVTAVIDEKGRFDLKAA